MQSTGSHIISKFRWDTSFDQKEKASELQERLSGWSRMNMQKEIMEVFDKICPPEQTWRIDSLELDLGFVNYDDLEFELAQKLRQQLNDMLIDLIIYTNKSGRSNIEILNEDTSHISVLRSFFLNGTMPWNYKPADGSVSQMMAYQLQNNRQQVIAMLREVGAVHENVRKRIAWQINDAGIMKIIEGLEPNNHTQVIDFSSEMAKIQMKETVVQTSTADFKKNLWLWILNYLLTERGTIFSKVAFMRSSIRQMADHYNVGYDELFELIERAADAVSKTSGVKADFIFTLKILSKENKSSKNNSREENEDVTVLRSRLKQFFEDPSLRNSRARKTEFNELVTGLFRQDRAAFHELIATLGNSKELWRQAISDLNDASLEIIFSALSPTKSVMLVESIYFLDRLSKELNLNIDRKIVWETGMEFLQEQKNASFDNTLFLNYCISELSKKNKVLKTYLLDQFISAGISSSAKTISSLEIYQDLTSVFISEVSGKQPDFLSGNFKELISLLGKQLLSPATDKKLFAALKRSLARNIQLHPKQALLALTDYSDKGQLQKLVPYILNEYTSRLLFRNTNKETSDVILIFRKVVDELKTEGKTETLKIFREDHLITAALHVLIFYPRMQQREFPELLIHELFERAGTSQKKQFSVFVDQLLREENIRALGISQTAAAEIKEKYYADKKRTVTERVNYMMSVSRNKQEEIGKILKADFSGKEFKQLRTVINKEGERILDYFVSGGKQLMEMLTKEYSILLRQELKQFSEKEMTAILQELYWKCIVDYNGHKGNAEALKRSFKKAVLFRFQLPDQKVIEEKFQKRTETKERVYSLKNGNKITGTVLFRLIEKCLVAGSKMIRDKEENFDLSGLIKIGLEADPLVLRKIIKNTVRSEKRMSVLKESIPFEQFSLWIMNDTDGSMKEAMESMRAFYILILQIAPGKVAERVADDCWNYSWKLIATGTWSAGILEKLMQDVIHQMAREMELNTEGILLELKKKNLQLTPALKAVLSEQIPAFSASGISAMIKVPAEELLRSENKGLLAELSHCLVAQKEIPAWFGNAGEQKAEELLNELIIHYPVKFLEVLKKEIITEPQMVWLSQSLDFKELIRSVGNLNTGKQSLLNILEGFYNVLGTVSVKGISAKEIQYLLFRKILKAWTGDNWRIVSTENIWNELTWDLCVKRGISKKDFFLEMEKKKINFPLSLQVSLEQVRDMERTSAMATQQLPVVKPKLPVANKKEAVSVAKGGIAVRNAGLVLISNYVEILFERLGITKDKKFSGVSAKTDAPHYLQFVATGLDHTEESLLPLNKVLCGLPLSEPLRDGIDISEEHKKLTEGLLKAVIGHWPAIGNCSTEGFRGNWLVRDGLLIEHDDKWELVVEKRAYDLLIHKSPFSFSIIKYPWMPKPLHVSWPY